MIEEMYQNLFSGMGANALLLLIYLGYQIIKKSKCHYHENRLSFDFDMSDSDSDHDEEIEKKLLQILHKRISKRQEKRSNTALEPDDVEKNNDRDQSIEMLTVQ